MYRAKTITNDDILFVLDNLREEDRIECQLSRGVNYKKLILDDFMRFSPSDFILLAKTKNEDIPVLIAGACSLDNQEQIGSVFLLSTPEIEKHQICFLREMKKELEKYDEKFSFLFNKIYKTNKLAKNWLKWAGFIFPQEQLKPNFIDKEFLKLEIPKDFEFFYRERKIKGLGE